MKVRFIKIISMFLIGGELLLKNGWGMEKKLNSQAIENSYEMIIPHGKTIVVPENVSQKIFLYLKDEDAQSAFSAICKGWKNIADVYFNQTYHQKNIDSFIVPWSEHPQLSPRMLNCLNKSYVLLLGLSRNLHSSREKSPIDRVHFERTCQYIKSVPFVNKESLILSYVDLVLLISNYIKPSEFLKNIPIETAWLKSKLSNIEQEVGLKLLYIRNQINYKFQNELSLYFHYVNFIANRSINNTIKTDSILNKITCNLVDVVKSHDELMRLQSIQTQNKTAVEWKKIMELDPAPLYEDLFNAGVCFYNARKREEGFFCLTTALDMEQRGGIDTPNLRILRNLTLGSFGIQDYHNTVYFCEQFIDQCLQQPGEAKKFMDDQIKIARAAAESYGKLGNKEKQSYYRKRMECIEKVEDEAKKNSEEREQHRLLKEKIEADKLQNEKIVKTKEKRAKRFSMRKSEVFKKDEKK